MLYREIASEDKIYKAVEKLFQKMFVYEKHPKCSKPGAILDVLTETERELLKKAKLYHFDTFYPYK